MNIFSRQLSSIIVAKEINITQMASFCKIDRSSMYKIVRGTRKPASEAQVELMALYMKLTPEETGVLMEKYRIMQTGAEHYFRRKTVAAFLQRCFEYNPPLSPSIFFNPLDESSSAPDQSSRVLNGESNVLSTFSYLFHRVKKQPDSHIYIRMPPDRRTMDIIRTVCGDADGHSRKKIQIEHIFALDENKVLTDSDIRNINVMSTMLPVLKSVSDYNLYYYYANLLTGNRAFLFLPCAVITDEYALQFSEDLQFGLLHKQQETVTFFKKTFNEIKSGCIPLTVEIRDYRDLLYCNSQRRNGNNFVSFHMHFGLGFILNERTLEKYLKMDLSDRSFIKSSLLELSKKDMQFLNTANATLIISEKGIRDFMETGILPDYPIERYDPIQPEDRFLLLCDYMKMIREHDVSLRIIKESFGNTSSRSRIWVDDRLICIHLQDISGACKVILIRDPGLLSLLNDFFRNMPEVICMSQEASMDTLQNILDEYNT